MAKNRKTLSLFQTNKKIKDNLNFLQKGLDDLYQDINYTQKTNSNQADEIRDRIDQSISNIMGNSYTNNGIGSISKIYTRMELNKTQKNQDLMNAIDVFSDKNITNEILASYTQNKWLRDMDYEIDTVLKYMPKLKEALKIKKDCVLSADHFSKDFASFHSSQSQNKQELLNKRIDELKKIYSLSINYEKFYDNTQTYGEAMIYIVPYNREFNKLLANRGNTYSPAIGENSMSLITEGTLNATPDEMNDPLFGEANKALSEEKYNLTVNFNKSGVIESVIRSYDKVNEILIENSVISMKEQFTKYGKDIISEAAKQGSLDKVADKLIPDDLELPGELNPYSTASDGLVGAGSTRNNAGQVKVPGCIMKLLDRANVIPIYIEDLCLGYYYLEFKNNTGLEFEDPNYMEYSAGLNTLGGMQSLNRSIDKYNQGNRESLIRFLSKKLSDSIDANFINANQDIRREIYMILKHNDIFNSQNGINGAINITFIPPEDMIHMNFELDPITHRGVSDLKYSLFPAKLYSCLYITNTLGVLTRGQDKRVYYVKQNIDTNVSATMLNVLNQIKKGNFGARQMENLSSILNITGRFNDFLIPLSPSGESPVQFEVMEGQKFEFPTELMDKLEEMAINPTEIPVEAINARQTLEYAIQATMSNIRVARAVYKRQDLVEYYFSLIINKLYYYEYGEELDIEMTLPAPSFINMANGSQLIQGTMQYVQALADTEMAGATDEEKSEFIKLANRHYLSNHIDISLIEKLKAKSRMNVELAKKNNEE